LRPLRRFGGRRPRDVEFVCSTYIEFVVFQYMLMVLAQLLTVESSTVCRHTRNTRVTIEVDTMVAPVLGYGSRRPPELRLPAPGTTTLATQPHPRHRARIVEYGERESTSRALTSDARCSLCSSSPRRPTPQFLNPTGINALQSPALAHSRTTLAHVPQG
jgi:hypothetical protein